MYNIIENISLQSFKSQNKDENPFLSWVFFSLPPRYFSLESLFIVINFTTCASAMYRSEARVKLSFTSKRILAF